MSATTRFTDPALPEPPALYLALELSNRSWKLAFSTGHGQKPHRAPVRLALHLRILRLATDPEPQRNHRPLRSRSLSLPERGRSP